MLGLSLSLSMTGVLGGGGGGAPEPTLFEEVEALFAGGTVNGGLYDISNLSTLFVERTGAAATTPASIDGPVGTVLDLSGNGCHRVAPSDAARAILRQDATGIYLEYAADGDCYQASSFVLSNRFYLGLAIKGATSGSLFIEHSATAVTNNGFFFFGSSNSTWLVRSAGSNHSALGVANWEGTAQAVADLIYRTSSQNFFLNGVEQANNTISGTLQAQANVTSTLNIMTRNGGAVSTSNTWEYGMVLLDGEVSDHDAVVMRAWLATLNGVPGLDPP
jgi:hypothetical protein